MYYLKIFLISNIFWEDIITFIIQLYNNKFYIYIIYNDGSFETLKVWKQTIKE